MTALTFTQPLTPTTPENATNLQTNFTTVTTWANGNVDDTNMASGYDVAPLYSVERTIFPGYINMITGMTAATSHGIGCVDANALPYSLDGSCVFRYDSTLYSVTGRTASFRLSVNLVTGGTSPGVNWTVALYPVTGISAGAPTLGAAVASSSVTITNPGANGSGQGAATFTAPATGNYALVLTSSGTQAANSYAPGTARLSIYYT